MPTLNWIGKDAVIRHHKDVPFRLLEPDPELSHGDGSDGNLIVEGDNLHALKALLPKYAGKVKCIYIDPPYNTGKEGWAYNDNVNSPEILKWLGQTVGKEAEDLSRHDKWLCMMYPRLVILKQFLTSDGAIFVSIDDNEIASLRYLMDEIFGRNSFVKQISWQKVYTVKNSAKQFSEMHDHIVVYASDGGGWTPNLLNRTSKQDDAYTNPDGDSRGLWKATPVHARNRYDDGRYEILSPLGKVILPPTGTYWRFAADTFKDLEKDGRIWWGEDQTNIPAQKTFLSEVKSGVTPSTMWFHKDAGHNAEAKNEIREILGSLPDELLTPKPVRLIQRIIQLASDRDSIILDSFAGSGTTAQAVLEQNLLDGGSRKFILIECIKKTAKEVLRKRIFNLCNGYAFSGKKKTKIFKKSISWSDFSNDAKRSNILTEVEELTESKKSEFDTVSATLDDGTLSVEGEVEIRGKRKGLGSGFQYCRLSEEPLFNEFGDIRDDVTFAQLADFVWFAETGIGFTGASDSPLLGVHQGTAIYLLFNGILGDRKPQGGNILTKAILDTLPPHDGPKVIYAAATRLGSAALQREQIIFKQTPYAIEV